MNKLHALIRGHRNNLERYHRLLATRLTELERDYIYRRMAEEQAALDRLQAKAIAQRREREASPETVIAAASLARESDAHPAQMTARTTAPSRS
jgi:hypothetical protein